MENQENNKQFSNEEQTDLDDDIVARLLNEVGAGTSIQIRRARPGWCHGFLETIDYQEGDEPIDMQYLVDTWGGEILSLRVKKNGRYIKGVDVPLCSFQPKRWGQVITRADVRSDGNTAAAAAPAPVGLNLGDVLNLVDRVLKTAAPVQAAAPALPYAEIFKLLGNFIKTSQIPAPAPTLGGGGIDDVLKTARALKELRELIGGDLGGVGPADSEPDMMGQITKVIEAYSKIRENDRPPRLIPVTAAAPVSNPAAAGFDMQAIGAHLRALGPQEIARSFLGVVGGLPEDQREEVFSNILGELGLDAGDDVDEGADDGADLPPEK
jgi:hypothetical protein